MSTFAFCNIIIVPKQLNLGIFVIICVHNGNYIVGFKLNFHPKKQVKTPKDDIDKAVQNSMDIVKVDDRQEEHISGPSKIYPYETHTYELKNSLLTAGTWSISNMSRRDVAKIISIEGLKVTIKVMTGKKANFVLDFIADNYQVSLPITVGSL